jgi:tRNA(Ile)-lysidine synthase
MSRGSGLRGLAAMQRMSRLDAGAPPLQLVRPLLDVPKVRLIATCKAAKAAYADDPSNRDPRFTRSRLRELMPALAREGLTARRLAVLAQRLRRADRALEAAVNQAENDIASRAGDSAIVLEAKPFARLPAEIALRLLGRAVAGTGDEGPVELAKLESLYAELKSAQNRAEPRFRRTLAGAQVTLADGKVLVELAPPRHGRPLTKAGRGKAKTGKSR